jgi:hypothetical protein
MKCNVNEVERTDTFKKIKVPAYKKSRGKDEELEEKDGIGG